MKKVFVILFSILFFNSISQAEELNGIFKRTNDFIAQKNFSKAMSELDWAKKEIEKMHYSRVEEFFPNELLGFKGAPAKKSAALGLSNYEREYTGEEGQIRLLTFSSSQGARIN